MFSYIWPHKAYAKRQTNSATNGKHILTYIYIYIYVFIHNHFSNKVGGSKLHGNENDEKFFQNKGEHRKRLLLHVHEQHNASNRLFRIDFH